ncbi:MAG: Lrp/AsnC family transcriptional regulator [Deltaproteobacteria bacterium]|nr:Lrp/AsnC family transcriptional regulator [Deltaproteobacteria bacterium]
MKFGEESELDEIDLRILALLQENCKLPLAKIGERVGLSAPSVIERIKKLEDAEVIIGYRAILNARSLGKDVTAFIGVLISHPKLIGEFEAQIVKLDGVLECHHVTGQHTLLLKVKTEDTSTLEQLISAIRSIEGVDRTETMVVLSTHTERTQLSMQLEATQTNRRARRNGERRVQFKGA